MTRDQLISVCTNLGLAVAPEMTVAQLETLLSTASKTDSHGADQTIRTPVADATVSLTKKQSVIKGFNYTVEFVRIVFANGDSALLDKKDSASISTALTLKGQPVEYRIGAEQVSPKGTKYHKVFIDCIG